jgi:beta-glucosidase-like glycosyl hydrolase/CubicO group peptidase (beta-lactamase class C family)
LRRVARGALLAALAGLACRAPARVAPEAAPQPTPRPSYPWARATLASLSLEQKVAQMVGVRANGLYRNPEQEDQRALRREVQQLGVGSLVVFESEVESLPRVLNDLQEAAKVPLLVSADMERGLSFRVRRGVVPLPYAMAVGASGSEDAARFMGEVTAREARAVGIHWALAPVADVNNNPQNPVINIRSFGEDPERVGRLSAAFVAGVRSGGLLATVKHFPGHGDTATDSHLRLAQIGGTRDRLDAVELQPFRRAIEAGVDSVMLGHIAVPSLDPSGAPATLSQPIATDLLRRDLGFEGIVVTDALEMQGVRAAWTGEAAVRAVQAGADVILLPPQASVAIQAVARAVREGALTEARIDASVLRILEAKERLGLHRSRKVDPAGIRKAVGRPEDWSKALAVAKAGVTVVKNEGDLLPLRAEEPLSVLHLVMSSDARVDPSVVQGIPEAELQSRRIPAETMWLGPEVADATAQRILERSAEFTHVIASAFVRVGAFRGNADISEAHARLLSSLAGAGRKLVVVSFGSPYLLRQFPEVPAYVCSYGWAETSQRAAMGALFGEFTTTGRLPVSLPGLYASGHGLRIPAHAMTLGPASEDASVRPGLAEVSRVIEAAIAAKAFPGAVLAVGREGQLVELRAFGRLSYDEGAPAAQTDTIYDLASLTKVIVTTTVAMMLVDEGLLDLDKPVRAFLPGFRGGAKDRVTVRQLLTHSSGIDWWAPLYQDTKGQAAYVEKIVAMDLAYEPGAKSLYSDLGLVLLGEILERVAGEPLDAFARRRLLDPLGMRDTRYRPAPALVPRIAPTENDPWRGRLLRGEVHDENAFAIGGTAPHAGLFGTAPDLARFAQMLLYGGVFEQKRYVARETVEAFTKPAGVPSSSRALGWDTVDGTNSAGALMSARAFGHTGFTGTSLWIDPEKRLFVVLLTNRVHPTRENNAIRQVRRDVADAVVRALAP